jgi:hypothetical protein
LSGYVPVRIGQKPQQEVRKVSVLSQFLPKLSPSKVLI